MDVPSADLSAPLVRILLNDPDPIMTFSGRVAIQDLVLPLYRKTIYERLERRLDGGLGIFTGVSPNTHGVVVSDELAVTDNTTVPNRHFLGGPLEVIWQSGFTDWLKDFRPDVAIVSGNARLFSTKGGVRWLKSQGVPVVGWGLGTLMMGPYLRGLRTAMRKRLLHTFDGLIAYSSKAKEQYIELGVDPDRISIAYNAIAPRPNHPAPDRAQSFEDGGRLLFVGRLYPGKRLDLLFEAVASLGERFSPSIDIVGDGPGLEATRALAEDRLPGRVTFHGALYGDALDAAFRAADLFILPGMGGLAIQEAMSWGLPIIAAEGDGTQFDLVREGNGWLMEPGSAASLQGILEVALSDCPALRSMGVESHRIVCDELNLDRMIDAMVAAVDDASRRFGRTASR